LLDAETISDAVLASAAGLAAASRHPYARAIVAAAEKRLGKVVASSGTEELSGEGLKRRAGNDIERLGSAAWCGLKTGGKGSEVWYRWNDEEPVRFRFADRVRSDSAQVIASLKSQGYGIALLSGDREGVVETVAGAVGIDLWLAELKPSEKIAALEARARDGRKVLMVGDGLNDAPALAAAHASISPASAADISQRAADFVFQGEKLAPVLEAMAIAHRARAMALENFGVAFVYNIVCVPLAMAGFVTPLIAAIVMSTSSILVTANALRLAGGPKL
jgi:Cu2+-exporting ATPase